MQCILLQLSYSCTAIVCIYFFLNEPPIKMGSLFVEYGIDFGMVCSDKQSALLVSLDARAVLV